MRIYLPAVPLLLALQGCQDKYEASDAPAVKTAPAPVVEKIDPEQPGNPPGIHAACIRSCRAQAKRLYDECMKPPQHNPTECQAVRDNDYYSCEGGCGQ